MTWVKLTLVSLLAVSAGACGGDAGDATTTAPTSSSSTIATTTSSSSVTSVSTSTTAAPTSTAPEQQSTTTLAGSPIDFGPAKGDVLMVIGVRHDDFLNLRAGPGVDQPIEDEIPPTFDDLVALGATRDLSTSFWVQVEYGGTSGWVHMGYIGYQGDTTDSTAMVIDELGERPVEATMTSLGSRVASVFVSGDVDSDVVQVTPVTTGDLNEVSYDVIGLADDAVRGVRLHVFATEDGGQFTLHSVEVTIICGRGVDAGACV